MNMKDTVDDALRRSKTPQLWLATQERHLTSFETEPSAFSSAGMLPLCPPSCRFPSPCAYATSNALSALARPFRWRETMKHRLRSILERSPRLKCLLSDNFESFCRPLP